MVNYIQAYLESLVTRLSLLLVNCQKPGKSGSTMIYQAHQAFNQTFGARVILNPESGLVDRLMFCSSQERSNVK